MSQVNDIRAQIKEIRDLTKQYGQLVQGRTLPFPVVLEIIEYYEEYGEETAIVELEAEVEKAKQDVAKARGANGGLTKKLNKAKATIEELSNVQKNNVQLSRITQYATELIEYLRQDHVAYVDQDGDDLIDNPLFIKLNAEISE